MAKPRERAVAPTLMPSGNGTVSETRLYQLVRQEDDVRERTFEVRFLDAGVEAYVFTFG